MSRRLPLLLALALAACADPAADPPAAPPALAPEGFDLPLPAADGPRPVWQTEAERRQQKEDSFDVRGSYQDIFGFTPPPADPVRAVAEFETTDAVLVAWDGYLTTFTVDVIRALTDASLVYVTTPSLRDSRAASDSLARAGVDLNRVRFFEFPHETFWTRDFGPIPAVSPRGAPLFIDPAYYPDRRRDDAIPTLMGRYFTVPAYRPALDLEGGNFMTNGEGLCVTTEWLVEQNHPKPVREIRRLARDYFGCEALVILERLEGEGTGHVDMFAKFLDRDTVLLGEYLRAEDPTNHAILERNAQRLAEIRLGDAPLEVIRIPMPRPADPIYRSYTNSTLVNDTVVVPTYRRDRSREAEALAVYRRALPGYRILTVEAEDAIELGGAVHCVTMGFVLEGRGPIRPTPAPIPAPEPAPAPAPEPEDVYAARPGLPIRDGQRTTDTLSVPDPGRVGRLTVELDIRHSYIGDLRITLRRGEREVELHRFTGGDSRDLRRAYTIDSFAGVERAGAWILSVEDHYQGDEGELAAWGLRFE